MLKLKVFPIALVVVFVLAACRPAGGDAGAPTGQYDCSGHEAGLLAYAGRFTFETGGAVSFEDYDGEVHSGTFDFDAESQSLAFDDDFVFVNAVYVAAAETLDAVVADDASLPHADLGVVDCERAVPGVTGP